MPTSRLDGKVIAITGAGSGVGLTAALACAREGGRLVLLDRDRDALARCEDLVADPTTLGVVVDIGDPDSVAAAFAAISARFGRLDGLFNNAGLAHINESERIEDVSLDSWDLMIRVNLTGTFLCCREAIALMESSGGGVIVNNASTAALIAEPGLEAYSAAKAGVVALSRSLAASSASRGIRVNVMCPGLIRTPMASTFGSDLTARLSAATLLDVPGPEALEGMLVHLLSDESSYMTGSVVVIDGGLTTH